MENLKLISFVVNTFTNTEGFDRQMKIVLSSLGDHFNASRSYIFLCNSTNVAASCMYEWCNKGVVSQIDELKTNGYDIISFSEKMLEESDMGNVQEIYGDIFSTFQKSRNGFSLVCPLIVDQKIRGFIGIEESREHRNWEETETELLQVVLGIVVNAYTQKRLQDRLLCSKKNFKNFFNTVEDLFIVGNTKGEILYVNNAVMKKLAYSFEELKRMNILDLHPEDRRVEATTILSAMFNKEIASCPLELRCADGRRLPVETRIWLGKWDEQDCIFGISKDLSKEQEALQKFTKLFENNPAPMAITNSIDGRFLEVNFSFLDKLGYGRSEIIGKTSRELELFVDLKKQQAATAELKQFGYIKDKELQIKCKNGKVLIGLFSGEIINDQKQDSFLTVMLDITEQMVLAQNIEFQKNRLESLIQCTCAGTWEWNVQSGEVFINEMWAQMLGYTLQELQPISIDTWKNLCHPDDQDKAFKVLQEHFEKRSEHYFVETRMKHKDGKWRWILGSGKVIEWGKECEPIKMFGVHIDISLQRKTEAALVESEKRFDLALNGTEAGLWDWDMVNNKVFFSVRWKSMLGYEENDIENSIEGWKRLWHPADASKIEKAMDNYINGISENYEVVYRLRHKNGQWRWILTRGGIIKDSSGNPQRWVGTNLDITTEKEKSEELERFFRVNLDLLCIADYDGNFLKINPAWSDVIGYSVEEIKQTKFWNLIHFDDIEVTLKILNKLKNQEQVMNFVNRYRCKNGEYRHIEWRAHPYEKVVYAAARDITDRIETEKKLRELSTQDPLTHTYNRRYVFERLEELLLEFKREGTQVSVAMIDIDCFKNINDTYGHQAGDFVLEDFAKIISETLNRTAFVGRYGGEEFIVVSSGAVREQTASILKEIRNKVCAARLLYNQKELKITFSAGISDTSEHTIDVVTVEKIINQADERLYKAKQTGRNKIVIN